MGPDDCRGACSGTAGCLVWQFLPSGFPRGCFIHDGTLGDSPVCTADGSDSIGARRSTVPPPVQNRQGVTWANVDFADSTWSTVDAPHDFILLGEYTEEADSHHGYLPRNLSGWYRKGFSLPSNLVAGGRCWIHFEGVFQQADVWVNGRHLLHHTSGYLGFDVDLSDAPVLYRDGVTTNVIAIRVDASFGSGHWYEGGGLVRQSWLHWSGGPARFTMDGVYAQPEGSIVSLEETEFSPTAEVDVFESTSASIKWRVYDDADALVAQADTATQSVQPSKRHVLGGAKISVTSPSIWSIKRPHVYNLVADLFVEGSVIDTVNTTVGFRNISWQSSGFKLNGEHLRIRGFSHHSDFGAVGAAVPDRINLFRANALRAVGGNTWRTSHNPYRPAVYEILNRVGVLVWDENRDFNQMNIDDMANLVRRDRNHPAVVIWSACNEIECYVTGPANVTGAEMRKATKMWDTTRPFSANLNQVSSTTANDTGKYLASELDVEGFSHGTIANHEGSVMIHQHNPNKAVISSECCSCQSQRGEDYMNKTAGLTYTHTLAQAQCMQRCMNLSYPTQENGGSPTPSMGSIAGTLGVWTLFDYAGEPGPWPLVGSSFGQFDLAGFAKSAAFWYRALWLATPSEDDAGRPPLPKSHVVRISQSWVEPPPKSTMPLPPQCNVRAWSKICPAEPNGGNRAACLQCCKAHAKTIVGMGCSGVDVWPSYCMGNTTAEVQVFSDLPLIELYLNGHSFGRRTCTPSGFASWPNLDYAPGNLTAVGLSSNGIEQARHEILSASKAVSIKLSIDVPSLSTGTGSALVLDGHDCGLVRASVVDSAGRIVGTAANEIAFEVVNGPGRIVGVHNGDAKSHEPQLATSRSAYHGLARAAVKVTRDLRPTSAIVGYIDKYGGDGRKTVALTSDKYSPGEIVVRASSPGLTSDSIAISVSTNFAEHSVLSIASASVNDQIMLS